MILTVSDFSDEPLQAQISRQIRAKILSGDLKPEEPLPSIRGLARQVKVSVITVQRAYENLLQNGLLVSRRGKGFFVAPISGDEKHGMAVEKLKEKLTPIIERALAEGMSEEEILELVESILPGGRKQ
jgi:GntR family transcriptional regulator